MDWIEAFNNSNSKSDVCRAMNLPINGTGIRKVSNMMLKLNLDDTIFDIGYSKRKYPNISKICPICGNQFKTKLGHPKETITCSSSCSNTYFRTGVNHGSWTGKSYKIICFNRHERKCIICGEVNMVAVHHYNENHDDNSEENLIPMCPTHHHYMHSKYKNLIIDKVEDYRNKWIDLNNN